MMTFQELTDSIGSEEIYLNTSVDAATQGALLEYLFDRYLTQDEAHITTWLRQYRRNLNMFYPMYLDYLDLQSNRSELDPFISILVEHNRQDDGETTNTGSGSHTGSSTITGSEHTITDNLGIRTPDLTTTGSNTNTRTDDLANSVTSHDTRTDNLASSVTSSDTRTDNLANSSSSTTHETSSTDHGETSTDNTQNRTVNIAYPEANMGAIPTAGVSGFPTSIDYAEAEVDSFGEANHTGSSDNNTTTDSSVTNSGTNTGTVSNQGSQSGTNTGTVDNQGTQTGTQTGTVKNAGSDSRHETGTDRNKFDGDVTRSNSNTTSSTENDTNTSRIVDSKTGKDTEKGRRETKAALLKQAINCVISTNAMKWLVNSLQLCFDNYSEM